MIKAVLFDYDGVITEGVPDSTLVERLAKNLSIPINTAQDLISKIWAELLKGHLSEDEVWNVWETELNIKVPNDKKDIWFKEDELKPLPMMIDLVNSLRGKDYKVGILSNVTKTTADIISKIGAYSYFDFAVLSYQLGYKKPEPEIFKIALEKLGNLNPKEVIFLDDRSKSTEVAKKMGFEVILVSDHKQAIKELNHMLS